MHAAAPDVAAALALESVSEVVSELVVEPLSPLLLLEFSPEVITLSTVAAPSADASRRSVVAAAPGAGTQSNEVVTTTSELLDASSQENVGVSACAIGGAGACSTWFFPSTRVPPTPSSTPSHGCAAGVRSEQPPVARRGSWSERSWSTVALSPGVPDRASALAVGSIAVGCGVAMESAVLATGVSMTGFSTATSGHGATVGFDGGYGGGVPEPKYKRGKDYLLRVQKLSTFNFAPPQSCK